MQGIAKENPSQLVDPEFNRVLIYWEFDRAWYYATVEGLSNYKWTLKYADEEIESIDLRTE
jgi:hypothetical protein